MRLVSEDVLDVERDAGLHETLHRVADNAMLPADLPGRYHNADMAATWTIDTSETGITLHVAGPLLGAARWQIEPIEGDFIRIVSPTPLFRAWLDVCVLRDRDGGISGLHVDGGRVRNVFFARELAQ